MRAPIEVASDSVFLACTGSVYHRVASGAKVGISA
jgi:hypothetical protein